MLKKYKPKVFCLNRMAFSVNDRYVFARATVSRGHVGDEDDNEEEEEVVEEEIEKVVSKTEDKDLSRGRGGRKFPRSK